MTLNQGPIKPSTRFSAGREDSWGPYWDVMFPPTQVTGFINWKRGSTGVNIARRFWEQREYLRGAYEAVFGSDPDAWPSRHPGVVLDAVPEGRYGACLRCQWLGPRGYPALKTARLHETSEGSQP